MILPSFSSTALLPCLKAPPLPQAHTLLQPALLLTSNLPTPSFSPLKMLFQYDQVANNAIVSPSSSHTIQSTALLQLQFQLTAEVVAEVVVVVVVVLVVFVVVFASQKVIFIGGLSVSRPNLNGVIEEATGK